MTSQHHLSGRMIPVAWRAIVLLLAWSLLGSFCAPASTAGYSRSLSIPDEAGAPASPATSAGSGGSGLQVASGVAQDENVPAFMPFASNRHALRPSLTEIGRVIGGEAESVAVLGTLAFVGFSDHLAILDIVRPSAPQWLGSVDLDAYDIAVGPSGDLLYAAASELVVVDVSVPSAPTKVSAVREGTRRYAGVALSGGFAYVTNHEGLQVFDLADPRAPRWISGVETPRGPKGIQVRGDHAYVAAGVELDAALVVVDVSEPSRPEIASVHPVPGISDSISVSDGVAYLNSWDGVRAIDVSDPASPVEIGHLRTAGEVTAVAGAGSVLYAHVRSEPPDRGIAVIDRRDPARMAVVGLASLPSRASGMDLAVAADGHVYVAAARAGLRVVNVRTPDSPGEVGWYEVIVRAEGVAVSGSHAYVADWYTGLRVVDIGDPTAPRVVGVEGTAEYANNVVVSGAHAFVGSHLRGLRIVDVLDPRAPREVGVLTDYASVDGVAVSGQLAYVVWGKHGVYRLSVFDITDPARPREIAALDTGTIARSVDVQDSVVYVGLGMSNGGLLVVDVSDPARPTKLGLVDAPSVYELSQIKAIGDRVLAVAGHRVYEYDVSEPTAPRLMEEADAGGSAHGIAADEQGYAYVATLYERTPGGYIGRLNMLQLSEDRPLRRVARADMPASAQDVEVSGDLAVTACDQGGLVVSRITR